MTHVAGKWHAQGVDAVVHELGSGNGGLSSGDAGRRLYEHGPNVLPRPRSDRAGRLLCRQFNTPIGWLLTAAGTLAVVLGRPTDAVVVFGAVVINAVLGFIQEYRAAQAIAALSAMIPETATVLRDGSAVEVSAETLVPGDVVVLRSGSRVPADLRLLSVRNLMVEEAALTGESVPVGKCSDPVHPDAALGERSGMAFSGTLAVQGTAAGIVVATGNDTELGRINMLLSRTAAAKTPLSRQLARVMSGITAAVAGIVALLIVFGIWIRSAPPGDALMAAVSLAVAAIPEGLPAVVTIALAIGVRRMAERHAVVRYLPSVETLGSATVICSDKTGTLTRNEMTVQAAWCPDTEYRFSGTGYAPEGDIEHDGARLQTCPDQLSDLLICAALCNDAALRFEDGLWAVSGDPTEAALVVAARKGGLDPSALHDRHQRTDVIPFESDAAFMVTLNRFPGGHRLLVKGAPEAVFRRCTLSTAERRKADEALETYARQGLRVIACAQRHMGEERLSADMISGGLDFLGIVGMMDPPRTEALDAISRCHAAGISVKMITGDHPVTAEAIGRQLGLLHGDQAARQGRDIDLLTDDQLRDAVKSTNVFARLAPEHKIRLVEALQADGQVVAMTGDGVNDAPALKRADIGIAMGLTGTAVAREAAGIILTDDNFASLAAAVEEGRRVYDNLVKSLAFILPTNLGLACILSVSIFFFPFVSVEGNPVLLLALSPTQTLWINLVASITLSVPLAFERLEPDAMRRPPRSPQDPVFSIFLIIRMVLVAAVMTAGACGLFLWEYFRASPATMSTHIRALAEAQTVCVTSITLLQCSYLLSCRSLRSSLLSQGIFSNPAIFAGIGILLLFQTGYIYLPPLQQLFGSSPLSWQGWFDAAVVSLVIIPLISGEKRLRSLFPRGARRAAHD